MSVTTVFSSPRYVSVSERLYSGNGEPSIDGRPPAGKSRLKGVIKLELRARRPTRLLRRCRVENVRRRGERGPDR
ncbi:hypothetical protein EVAR_51192_1 [Eumeta japonica]|uniref:Uncharacterized protein n=1 Tax=Eumeta variegata TaxID=151549 RepID=A0A4C1XFI2_EUMVA|nr:hypothetical protein EVAR_51192_1 [Eumeta japonica]